MNIEKLREFLKEGEEAEKRELPLILKFKNEKDKKSCEELLKIYMPMIDFSTRRVRRILLSRGIYKSYLEVKTDIIYEFVKSLIMYKSEHTKNKNKCFRDYFSKKCFFYYEVISREMYKKARCVDIDFNDKENHKIFYYDENDNIDKIEVENINKIMDTVLSKRYADIIRKIYFDGMTYEEIGKMHNISRQRVEQIRKEAIKKLRKHIKKAEFNVKFNVRASNYQR